MHTAHMIIDLQYGSTGKGLLAGYLAVRFHYDTAVCSFATNAGHTYINKARGIHMMTQQLPTAICSPTIKTVMLGPGSLIHAKTLIGELDRYSDLMEGKRLMIHPHAAVVADYHAIQEVAGGMTKIGSTAKGVGAAAIERIMRRVDDPNTAVCRFRDTVLNQYVVTMAEYDGALQESENIIIEGAQGFGLSMYHGAYPYTTSRDVTPWQIAADCGLPFKWASRIQIMAALRTLPIRVNNRDGSSGPCYPDQEELEWADLKRIPQPEVTTVTKLQRRIFSFSHQQLDDALFHCGHYWETQIFLNFVNYIEPHEVTALIARINEQTLTKVNRPKVVWVGYGPDDADVKRIAK